MITNFECFKKIIVREYDEDTLFYCNGIYEDKLLNRKELLDYLKPNFFKSLELEDEYAFLVSLCRKKDIKVLKIEVV